MRDRIRAVRLLRDLLSLGIDVAAIEETHYNCAGDCHVLVDDYHVFSAYGNSQSRSVSLLVNRFLYAVVNLVHVEGRLVVADVSVGNNAFRVVAVYAPNSARERRSFFRRMRMYLTDPKRVILMADWNAILYPKIDKVGRDASGSDRCDGTLSDLIANFGLIDSFRLDRRGWRCGLGPIASLLVQVLTWT